MASPHERERPALRSFEDLTVWKLAHERVLSVYHVTRMFPAEERFGLVPQMRRAAVSVPANIAEGWKRPGAADKVRFYNVSQASLEELGYYLILCRDVGYVEDISDLRNRNVSIGRMLTRLIQSINGAGRT